MCINMHQCTSISIYPYAYARGIYMYTETKTHTLTFLPLVTTNRLPLMPYSALATAYKDDRLALALRGGTQPHTVVITDICGQDPEVHLNHVCLWKAHSCTCFNGVSSACGFSLIDVGITASHSPGVKGSGYCSKQFVVLCTST